jgi:citrate lyase beta subunit
MSGMPGTVPPQPGRVWIITPATRADRFISATTSTADVALADLEDSVAPADKQTARETASQFFDHTLDQTEPSILRGLRVNSPTTRDGMADLLAVTEFPRRPDVVLIPKVESPRDIEIVAAVLDSPGHAPHVWALIETPRAVAALPSIMAAPRLGGVVFGSADYAASVGCGVDWQSLLHARATVILGAAAAGLHAVDAPCFDLDDLDGLRHEAEQAKQLGFYGKGAVHPRHVEILHEVFTPNAADIARARAIVAAGQNSGGGTTRIDGHMVGPPFYAAAQALLATMDRR